MVLLIASCSKTTEDISNIDNALNQKAPTTVFLTSCPNETWDGDINHDCSGPPTNCVVICADVSSHVSYSDFTTAVKDGKVKDFYLNGAGMDVLPVNSGAYDDIINGNKTIYKVLQSNEDKYALY